MRLWTLHPRHLDSRGLVALWREALLAQKVLQNRTRGYKHHPQLLRFSDAPNPLAAIAAYLHVVQQEATRRGHQFDRSKITGRPSRTTLTETRGQLLYEWRHLQRKLKVRSPVSHRANLSIKRPDAHPLFRVIPGEVQSWEKR